MRHGLVASAFAASSLFAGCGMDMEDDVTREEAEQAIESANLASAAQALTYDVVEISTRFTLGKAAHDAAEELRAFVVSQSACTDVSVSGPTVTLDFGGLDDACAFRGRNYGGMVTLELESTAGALKVHHRWQDFTNGVVTVNGEADVTWSGEEHSRHVSYEMDFADEAHGKGPLHASGDVTQTLIDPELGLTAGIEVEGTREWALEDERMWTLSIEDVEMRGQDPVPQAGTYVLTTPSDKTLTMSFSRLSPTKIRVIITGKRGRTLEIDVVSIE